MITSPLVVKTLSKTFTTKKLFKKPSTFVAVNNISFALKQGEILGFLGPNGAGKTTTIQMLLDLLEPTSGSIHYFGKDLKNNKWIKQKIAYVSGYMKLPSSLSVRQALLMYGLLYDMKYENLKKKIEHFLHVFSIEHLADRRVTMLSSGQTTSVLLARAFLVDPHIILLDEPTAALDPHTACNIRTFIREQNQKHGISMLFTSHNMPEVTELCDRILVLKNGSIIADNTPELLAASVSSAKVQLIVGDGLKRTIAFAEEKKLAYKVEERHIEINIDEHNIAEFLGGLASRGVSYSQISIEKPTLEDFFLNITRKG